jgi:ATPase subunit of ABC transporter with duplicated ATPase domains
VRGIALPDGTPKVDTHSRMRLALARALFVKVRFMYSPYPLDSELTDVVQPALLLLDEPSNHSSYRAL